MQTWIWIVMIVAFIFVGLSLLTLAFCLWYRSREQQRQKSITDEKKAELALQEKNTLQLRLPLPPPTGSGDGGMEYTQTSYREMVLRDEKTFCSPCPSKSSKIKTHSSVEELSKTAKEWSKRREYFVEKSPSSQQKKTDLYREDPISALDSSCAQHSTTDFHVLRTSGPFPIPPTQLQSTTTTTAPISAGTTPRIARKILISPSNQSHPPLVIVVPRLGTSSALNTPYKDVNAAQEITDCGMRSENLGSVCDEDAGRTPRGTSPPRGLMPGGTASSTANSSRITTFTPSQSTSGTSHIGRPI